MNADIHARLALVSLPRISPARLKWLLSTGEAPAVVEALGRGRLSADLGPAPPGVDLKLVGMWSAALRANPVEGLIESQEALGIAMLDPSDDRWPFADDPEPPVLLFYRGDLDLLQMAPSVAVVGTRRCTTVGRTVAYQMGSDVAAAGGCVISGLALGIDGAAHRGALDRGGAALAVVGSGLDVVYPGGNSSLWDEVADSGLLLSEAPAGARPERWRFPARNRLIAGLSDAVVIVESHHRGGSLLTVDEAIDRGRPVLAVPGSVLSAASDGTNALLVDGAIPIRNSTDLLDYLGLTAGPPPAQSESAPLSELESEVEPEAVATDELSDLGGMIMAETATGPVHIDRLLLATSASTTDVLSEIQALVAAGRLVLDGSTVSRP